MIRPVSILSMGQIDVCKLSVLHRNILYQSYVKEKKNYSKYVNINAERRQLCDLRLWFGGISTSVDYLMPNPLYIYI